MNVLTLVVEKKKKKKERKKEKTENEAFRGVSFKIKKLNAVPVVVFILESKALYSRTQGIIFYLLNMTRLHCWWSGQWPQSLECPTVAALRFCVSGYWVCFTCLRHELLFHQHAKNVQKVQEQADGRSKDVKWRRKKLLTLDASDSWDIFFHIPCYY